MRVFGAWACFCIWFALNRLQVMADLQSLEHECSFRSASSYPLPPLPLSVCTQLSQSSRGYKRNILSALNAAVDRGWIITVHRTLVVLRSNMTFCIKKWTPSKRLAVFAVYEAMSWFKTVLGIGCSKRSSCLRVLLHATVNSCVYIRHVGDERKWKRVFWMMGWWHAPRLFWSASKKWMQGPWWGEWLGAQTMSTVILLLACSKITILGLSKIHHGIAINLKPL